PGASPVAGTGASVANPFGAGGPQANDITAAAYLLIKTQKLPPQLFADPYNDEVQFEPDTADPATRSNFADYRKSLAYSFANPYPDPNAAKAGYKWGTSVNSQFILAADRNSGEGPSKNSRNHEGKGQNVLFGDTHVE